MPHGQMFDHPVVKAQYEGGGCSSVHSQYSNQSSQPPPHSNVQGIAQTALHLHPSPPQRPRNDMTERDKVLKGNYYSPFTPVLTQDRENCMAAIWRFNNATNSSSTPTFQHPRHFPHLIVLCVFFGARSTTGSVSFSVLVR